MGGRLAHFAEKWEEITDNKWVLSIVRNGFRIPFIKIPPLSSVPIRMSQSSSPFLREEIENLLNKRAVERVQNPETPGFYSRIFLVPKKNGKFRLILDLSLLNRYIEKQAFKMETVKSVRQAMRLNDWAVSIDLTDAYLHVPIHRQSRKYLRFVHEDQVYHFSALPFGMSLSPLIFSKLMDVIAAFLRQRAISVFPYLDDWLIKNLIHNRLITQTKIWGWLGGAKVLCILHHWGVQLILAYSWARPAILVVGKGRGGMFLFLLFLHFHSCSSFFPVPLFHLLYSLFLSLFSLSLGDDTK